MARRNAHFGHAQVASLVGMDQACDGPVAIGFLLEAGGIAGNFATGCVPSTRQDLRRDCQPWSYFAQISHSATSYGSYGGAVADGQFIWGKHLARAPQFARGADAMIVFTMLGAYLLDQYCSGQKEAVRGR